jgi:uncharacterized membrane protein YbhN (UPF0104 family)
LKSLSKKLRLGGSAALLAFLAWRTDWGRMADAFAGLRVGWWLLAVALYAVTQLVSSLRWRLLAAPLGLRQAPGRFVTYYFVGMFFNLVLPTSVGGDVVRAWYLDGGSGRKLPAFLSVLADRASGLLMLIAIACAAAAVSPLDLPQRISWSVYGVGATAVVGVAVLFALAGPFSRAPQGSALADALPCGARLNRLPAAARDLRSAMFPSPHVFLVTTLLSVVVQSANVILVWLVGLALGLDVPASYYWVLVPVVTLLTLFPVSVNGMGVREWGTVLMLAPLGVAREAATALALLWFATFSAVSLAGAFCYLFGRFPRFEVRPDDEPVRRDPDQGREGQSRTAA